MTTSQNGWDAITSATSPLLRLWKIGPVTLLGHSGPPGFVLGHYALWWHEQIEPLWPPAMPPLPDHDDHWWSQRFIGGTQVPSNHWSATAVDLNALQHPQGTEPEDTFTLTACRRIRTKISGKYPVLKWGGDFRTTKDPMHTELLSVEEASKTEVRGLALELVETPLGRRLIKAQSSPVPYREW